MTPNKSYQVYQNNAVNTASGGELTLMLYNGCIKFIKQAIKDIQEKNFEAKNTNIQKAQNIIRELMLTLDTNVDIANQMMPLYDYMQHRLKEANVQNDPAILEDVLTFVVDFRDTWKQVIRTTRQQQFSQGAQV
ncbi:flagellar export chaperone FliS [Lentibacillus sediminis]|uniref:flagellar export chaperone FliS n=1 Tax=Lentibacillus sediminis TaxID=1940529 RepID=UPI000C1C2066|nr:flagellar export chaperone FliS [Lentibacillus sediminis]